MRFQGFREISPNLNPNLNEHYCLILTINKPFDFTIIMNILNNIPTNIIYNIIINGDSIRVIFSDAISSRARQYIYHMTWHFCIGLRIKFIILHTCAAYNIFFKSHICRLRMIFILMANGGNFVYSNKMSKSSRITLHTERLVLFVFIVSYNLHINTHMITK